MTNGDFKIKISVCENMAKDKVTILCHPELKEYIETMLIVIQDKIEEDNEKNPF